ncbi:hypothetical protein [Pedobacter sp. SYP-B3415]|uniref:hypothetical protein n=1 Tax=Pedobacter sp. SYP-B3415 TaxID=2496641 RepID=UPI00101C9A75|nr:hypothetical protein [Pedobacter sp. SYP-B3415]
MKVPCYLHDCRLEVMVGEQTVHLTNNTELARFLSEDTKERTLELALFLKQAHLQVRGEQLKIADESLKTEIWGHVIWELQVLRLKKVLSHRMFHKIFLILLRPTAHIDCGAKGNDRNRALWDFLSKRKFLSNMLNPKRLLAKKHY